MSERDKRKQKAFSLLAESIAKNDAASIIVGTIVGQQNSSAGLAHLCISRAYKYMILANELLSGAATHDSFSDRAKLIEKHGGQNIATTIYSRGLCRYCGCTDMYACKPSCSWVDFAHTICSSEPCLRKAKKEGKEITTWMSNG